MKILFLTPYLPGPPVFGGQRRIHGLMTSLASAHEISVIAMVDPASDVSMGIRDAQTYCRHVVTVPDAWHRVAGWPKRFLQVASLGSTASWESILYRCRKLQFALDEHLRAHDYDVVSCEFAFMASYGLHARSRRRSMRTRFVLDEHNVEYDLLRRTAAVAATLPRKCYNAMNWRKLQFEEIRAWRGLDGCTTTSVRDQEIVAGKAATPTCVIPNGVDVEAFRPTPGAVSEPRTLLFFGTMNYFPNSDGIGFFVREILPTLRARYPGLRLRLVGPGTSGLVTSRPEDGVEVVGVVADLRAEIERAAVVVVPLRIGGGTRLKILEAMAVGRPVVSTRLGAEGLDVVHERDILLADTADAFALEVSRVLDDVALGERLGRAARETTQGHYSWRAAGEKLAGFYRHLLAVTH